MNWVSWIRSVRPLVSVFSGALVLVGFRIVHNINHAAQLLAATITAICIVTMLQNDWRDRWQDAKKGKSLACNHPHAFLAWTAFWWALSIVLVGVSSIQTPHAACLLIGLLVVAGIYSETRRIPFLPIILVSIVSSSPLLLPIAMGRSSDLLVRLFFGATAMIFAREILKDIEDLPIDCGYKWTIPVAFGERSARIVAMCCLVAALATLLSVMSWLLTPILFAIVATSLQGKNPATIVKWLLTITMGCLIGELLLL